MNVLGLVTARGGSKSIPRKNIAPLGGRPMLAYTAAAALASQALGRVVVSTDDREIAEVARATGLEVPFVRPAELAADDTPSLPVVQHAARWLLEHDGWRADAVVVLQPTSPLRRAEHIDAGVELLIRAGADTVVSVVEVPHRFSPYSLMRVDGDWLRDFWEGPVPFDRLRRQAVPTLYARNGPAVLVITIETLLDRDTLYGRRVAPLVMPADDSIDVDTPFDLAVAEAMLGRPNAVT